MCVLLPSVWFEFLLTGQAGVTAVMCVSLFPEVCMRLRSAGLVGVCGVHNQGWLPGNSEVAVALNLRAGVAAQQVPTLQPGAPPGLLFLILCPHVQGGLLRTQFAAAQHVEGRGWSLQCVVGWVPFFTVTAFPSGRA